MRRRKRASAPYRDARSPDVRRQDIASYRISREGAGAHERACGMELAYWMERPLARGEGRKGHATISPECKYRSTGSGQEFIYANPLCTNSRCPPTERQESNTSIYPQSFATIAL